MGLWAKAKNEPDVARYADMFSAMGTEPRLRIMRFCWPPHPEGLQCRQYRGGIDIPASTLSHHLDKLKNEELVNVRRESTFLGTPQMPTLAGMLGFLYAECCTRNKAIEPQAIVRRLPAKDGKERNDEVKEIVKEKYGEAARRVTSGGVMVLRGQFGTR